MDINTQEITIKVLLFLPLENTNKQLQFAMIPKAIQPLYLKVDQNIYVSNSDQDQIMIFSIILLTHVQVMKIRCVVFQIQIIILLLPDFRSLNFLQTTRNGLLYPMVVLGWLNLDLPEMQIIQILRSCKVLFLVMNIFLEIHIMDMRKNAI